MKNRGRLLDIIMEKRMVKELDSVLAKSREYKTAMRAQDRAFKRVEHLQMKERTKKIFGEAIDANNHCGAVYGEAAYRLGMRDGLRLSMEIRSACV